MGLENRAPTADEHAAMRKKLAVIPFLFLLPSAGSATTVNLTCSYDQTLDVDKGTTSPITGQLSVQIQFSEEQVTRIIVSRGDWCDPGNALVTEMEISFACGFNLASQRITYSFTFNRSNGVLEQRFFIGGKLGQVHYGQCRVI
jgi:hypothetical protein